jgi:hypothetical protein
MRMPRIPLLELLFHRGGLKEVFEHARNAVVATIFVAAGLEALTRKGNLGIFGLLDPHLAGYVVAGLGALLILVNFIDGLMKLARLRKHLLLQIAFSAAYFFVTLRVIQLIILHRTHPY